jgi:hypothetical protein
MTTTTDNCLHLSDTGKRYQGPRPLHIIAVFQLFRSSQVRIMFNMDEQ